MSANKAWLVKGWLLGQQNVPNEIIGAVNAVIESLEGSATIVVTGPDPSILCDELKAKMPLAQAVDSPAAEASTQKIRKPWSPEARAAAAERMKMRQAAKKAVTLGEAKAPSNGGA